MKIDWLHHTSPRRLVERLHEINLITEPFSDSQILDLQEKFLTNGFSYVKASSVVKGRSIINAFLNSLHVYHDPVCLSVAKLPIIQSPVFDLYTELQAGGYLSSFESYYLDEFFIERFYFDFMWIEATRELLISSWFEDVKSKMLDMGLDQHIPIIVVVYEKE